jgi:DNA invertase Pin-like site-specific DNA recombinase
MNYVKNRYGDLTDVTVCIEKKSARIPKKLPKLNSIIRSVKKDTVVVFYSVDRFSRNVKEGLELLDRIIDKEGSWYFIKEAVSSDEYVKDPIKKQVVVMALMNAEIESQQISNRVTRTVRFRKDNKLPTGPLYGIRLCYDNKAMCYKVVTVPEEKKVIDEIIEELTRFQLECAQLVDDDDRIQSHDLVSYVLRYLNHKGYKYRNGKNFTRRHVNNIMKLIDSNVISYQTR